MGLLTSHIPEEGMTMKSPPGSISPPTDCRDQLQIGPRTRVFGDGASGSSFWKIMGASMLLGQKAIYWRRRGSRRCPRGRGGSHPRPRVGPRQEAVPALRVASGAPLRTLSSSWRKNNLRKFWSNSANISRSKFLKQKDSKNRELAPGILSIG